MPVGTGQLAAADADGVKPVKAKPNPRVIAMAVAPKRFIFNIVSFFWPTRLVVGFGLRKQPYAPSSDSPLSGCVTHKKIPRTSIREEASAYWFGMTQNIRLSHPKKRSNICQTAGNAGATGLIRPRSPARSTLSVRRAALLPRIRARAAEQPLFALCCPTYRP